MAMLSKPALSILLTPIMRRYLSIKSRPQSTIDSEKDLIDNSDADERSTIGKNTAPVSDAPLPPVTLKVKRVDHYYSKWSRKWKYTPTASSSLPEMRAGPAVADPGKEDPWAQYCFVVVRTIPQAEDHEITYKVVVKSTYLLKACKEVIQSVPGVSWNSIPLELDPQLLLTFLPGFEAYQSELKAKAHPSTEEHHIASTIASLTSYLRTDYRATLATFTHLAAHGETTFALIGLLFVPRCTLLTRCPITGDLTALTLVSTTKVVTPCGPVHQLLCEALDWDPEEKCFIRTQSRVMIAPFVGTQKITELDVYPIEYHPREKEMRKTLVERGRKWAQFTGVHHMQYKATAAIRSQGKVIKYNLNSRVMIDKANFKHLHPNYGYPSAKPDRTANSGQPYPIPQDSDSVYAHTPPQHEASTIQSELIEPTDDDLLIATAVLYGFSLTDKLWLELNVAHVQPITWNTDAFANLVLPAGRKMLLQSLVEAHNAELSGFDDFIKGKGRGLVINLFGPPGVGKTLSAEATSEHVKRPLYVVGAADLGTQASTLDAELQRVFDLATSWKAIVLIDEADVFLEQRSLHDLERNAMVACFLRYLEYYPGILMLTTNRVRTFDEAFISRIHVSLHFHALEPPVRRQIWQAFLSRAGAVDGAVTEEQLAGLAQRNLNGRQVKNATRTANSLAFSRGQPLRFEHVEEVLNVLNDFDEEFKSANAD
ncbi:hypothetical protein HWV62_20186 [Athelia sp. TMB]|nr:hypothetical protein HWV62_20186 [Athelia sp. TMB]